VRGFKSSEAARLAGVSLRQLDHWDRAGLVRPSLAEAAGRGSARFYSFRDVVLLAAAARLREVGLPLKVIRKVVRVLAAQGQLEDPETELWLVVVGDTPTILRNPSGLVGLLGRASCPAVGVVLAVSALVRRLAKAAQTFRPQKGGVS